MSFRCRTTAAPRLRLFSAMFTSAQTALAERSTFLTSDWLVRLGGSQILEAQRWLKGMPTLGRSTCSEIHFCAPEPHERETQLERRLHSRQLRERTQFVRHGNRSDPSRVGSPDVGQRPIPAARRPDAGLDSREIGQTPSTQARMTNPAQIKAAQSHVRTERAPRRFVWKPALKIAGRSRARWACG